MEGTQQHPAICRNESGLGVLTGVQNHSVDTGQDGMERAVILEDSDSRIVVLQKSVVGVL